MNHHMFADRMELLSASHSSLSRLDMVDGAMLSHTFSVNGLEQKISLAKKRIEDEQKKQDENVQLYLKMAAVSQHSQIPQLKALFEKRNTKAANHIQMLRRKLEKYENDLQIAIRIELAKSPRPHKKLTGTSKGSDSGVSDLVSSPLPSLISPDDPIVQEILIDPANDDDGSQSDSGSSEGSDSEMTGSSISNGDLSLLLQQLYQVGEEIANLKEDFDGLKALEAASVEFFKENVQQEHFRITRLEEQVIDLTDLHQAETKNLRQAVADAEEKLCYRNEEQFRDLIDMLDSCQAKITRLEQQQSQLLVVEKMDNTTARALIIQLINGAVGIFKFHSILLAMVSPALAPFLNTKLRFLSSLLIGLASIYIQSTWPLTFQWVVSTWKNLLDRF